MRVIAVGEHAIMLQHSAKEYLNGGSELERVSGQLSVVAALELV
jgi:hypothetical protein